MNEPRDLAALIDGLRRRATDGRFLLGICGTPGAGKSTVAEHIATELGDDAVVVPMDGFHLASSVIRGTSRADRRGAPDTFDGDGFVALLRRLRRRREPVVFAPRYERSIEDPIAGAIPVPRETPVVVVEGNYLLHSEPPWSGVRELLDEVWYVEQADDATRLARLIARHIEFGKSQDHAVEFVHESDERNAALVASGRARADLVLIEQPDGRVEVRRP